MTPFASPEWVRQLDLALRPLPLQGPALRVRYRFTLPVNLDPSGTTSTTDTAISEIGYDLDLGDGARAHPAAWAGTDGAPEATEVTITQPLALAAAVAAGEQSAQRALLRGDITVTGDVTALPAWAPALAQIDVAMGPLRSRTDWRPPEVADPANPVRST